VFIRRQGIHLKLLETILAEQQTAVFLGYCSVGPPRACVEVLLRLFVGLKRVSTLMISPRVYERMDQGDLEALSEAMRSKGSRFRRFIVEYPCQHCRGKPKPSFNRRPLNLPEEYLEEVEGGDQSRLARLGGAPEEGAMITRIKFMK